MAGPPPEPSLSEAEREAFEKGLAEFNAGRFFECHDTLEDLWSGIRGPSRDFFQGLIQVAVGFYHLEGGNRPGALSLLRRGLGRLERFGERYAGLELGELRRGAAGWLARIEAGEGLPAGLEALPKCRLTRSP